MMRNMGRANSPSSPAHQPSHQRLMVEDLAPPNITDGSSDGIFSPRPFCPVSAEL
jgi:hypothetical protein